MSVNKYKTFLTYNIHDSFYVASVRYTEFTDALGRSALGRCPKYTHDLYSIFVRHPSTVRYKGVRNIEVSAMAGLTVHSVLLQALVGSLC